MPRTILHRGAASLVLLATVLGACSSASQVAPAGAQVPTATQATPVTATPVAAQGGGVDLDGATGLCAIFPPERAAAALGEPVGPARATHDTTFANASCQYESTASDATIAIWFHPGLTRDEWEKSMAKVGMTPTMAVAGIGDAAYRRDGAAAHPRVKLAAFQGGHGIWVIIERSTDIGILAASAEREARALLVELG